MHVAAGEIDDGLILEDELAQSHRLEELVLGTDAARDRRLLDRLVDVDALGPCLGAVERDVGLRDQLLDRLVAAGVDRDADAGVEIEARAPHLEGRLAQRADQALGGGARAGGVAVVEQQRELVAAEARQRVLLARRGLQARGDVLEQQVAGGMAERVVDVLEAVEVEEEERHVPAGAAARTRSPAAHRRRARGGWAAW